MTSFWVRREDKGVTFLVRGEAEVKLIVTVTVAVTKGGLRSN